MTPEKIKRKVGLLLSVEPRTGGAYQYTLSILDGVTALPDSYEIVVGYTDLRWEEVLKNYSVRGVFIRKGILARALGKLWRKGRGPMSIWRKIAAKIHPVGRALMKENCDLWIFPAQEGWTYEFPVSSLGVIHDLMHRYESQFPEVTSNGEFENREYHYNNLCRWTKGVLVDSHVGKQQAQESYNVTGSKFHILPFIAPKYITQAKSNGVDLRIYELPEKFLFYPAQFWEHKNHKRILEAMARLDPTIHMVFVGSRKSGFESARELTRKLDLSSRVHFLDYVSEEEMPELYRRARALVMPTFFGPTNIPPLEAFEMGCPVLVSGIYGMQEQLGDAAVYFDPKSVNEIAEAMNEIWTNDQLCAQLIEKGKKRAKLWGQNQFNTKLHQIVEKLIK